MKSDIKNKFIYEKFPDCFTVNCTRSFDVVIDDIIIALRGRIFGVVTRAPRTQFTVEELTRLCFRKCVEDVLNGTKVYVAVWDKASFVDTAKAPEQGQRDQRVADDVDLLAVATLEDLRKQMGTGAGPTSVGALGSGWAAMINNRPCRQAVIRMLASAAIREVPRMLERCHAPAGWQVWVDWDAATPGPICITSEGASRRVELKNELGEFDVSHLVYVHAAAQGVFGLVLPRVLVRTIDTDILCINMLHTTGATVETTLPKHKKSPVRVDTGTVVRRMLERWPMHSLRDFCECYLVSGSDFIIGGIRGVGQLSLVKAFYEQSGELTPLVQKLARARAKGSDAIARECGANHRIKRARYALNYWIDADRAAQAPSVIAPHPAQPLGHGWASNAGQIVCEETICPICIAYQSTCHGQKRKI